MPYKCPGNWQETTPLSLLYLSKPLPPKTSERSQIAEPRYEKGRIKLRRLAFEFCVRWRWNHLSFCWPSFLGILGHNSAPWSPIYMKLDGNDYSELSVPAQILQSLKNLSQINFLQNEGCGKSKKKLFCLQCIECAFICFLIRVPCRDKFVSRVQVVPQRHVFRS